MTSNFYPLLYSEYQLGNIILQNRIVMSPMTRSRAINNVPNYLMETYYRERAGAGLIITEGVAPSPNGVGYPRIPGLYNQEQVEGWKKVTGAVHDKGGRIFVQLMQVIHRDGSAHVSTIEANALQKLISSQKWGKQKISGIHPFKKTDVCVFI